MNELKKRSPVERLAIAETLLAGVWDDIRQGYKNRDLIQLAVNCQVDVNRIVWKLNEEEEAPL